MSSRSMLPAFFLGSLILTGCDANKLPTTPEPPAPDVLAAPDAWRGPVAPTVFATGLIFPRGLEFGPDGALYVAEAGSGGTTTTTLEQCTQVVPPVGPYASGNTARISRIDRQGNRTTLIDGLPSGQNSLGDVLGVNDVAFIGNTLYALESGGGCSHGVTDMPAAVIKIKRGGSGWSLVSDLSAYQAANPVAAPNPGDFEPDGSWYSMLRSGDDIVAVEPNHGELVRIDPRNGSARRIVDFSAVLGHIVPTVVAQRGGAFYVSSLGVFPQDPGTVKLLRVSRSGRVSAIADGFTMVLGLEFDRCGRLYVLETSASVGGFPAPSTGRVIRINRKGQRDVIATGLFFPTGMKFGPDGDLYISNNGFGPPVPGSILRLHVPGAHDRHDDQDMEHNRDD